MYTITVDGPVLTVRTAGQLVLSVSSPGTRFGAHTLRSLRIAPGRRASSCDRILCSQGWNRGSIHKDHRAAFDAAINFLAAI